ELKKVLAYSTVSQLGFMFLGVGMGGFTAGFFHVLTHAFFKACLFLGAGSVIHAMHARIHDDVASQDMRNMGGLHKHMPFTFWTFVVATAAIVGFPLTSGFFSKDEILFKAFSSSWVHPAGELFKARGIPYYTPPVIMGKVLFAVGVLAATLTAFYMVRALILTFFGDFRGWKVGKARHSVPPPAHGHDAHDRHDAHDAHDAHGHHHDDLTQPGAAPHESPPAMTVPLIVLAALAAFAGLLLNPTGLISPLIKSVFKVEHLPMEHWLDPVFEHSVEVGVKSMAGEEAHHAEMIVTGFAVMAFLVGSGLAYWMYVKEKGAPAKKLAESSPWLHRLLLNKWFVDEAYDASVISGVDALADSAVMIDRGFIDFLIARVSAFLVAAFGTLLRAFQTGVVHVYSAAMVVGLAAIGWFFVLPHPDAQIEDLGNGKYQVVAAPGLGYRYAFSDDPKSEPRKGTKNTFDVALEPGASKTVELRVSNVFQNTRSRTIVVTRPAGQSDSPAGAGNAAPVKLGSPPAGGAPAIPPTQGH
ncbi:MAG: NADH-quinone oxidoreductase subunit L, partial [Proteobacteria bacterium]